MPVRTRGIPPIGLHDTVVEKTGLNQYAAGIAQTVKIALDNQIHCEVMLALCVANYGSFPSQAKFDSIVNNFIAKDAPYAANIPPDAGRTLRADPVQGNPIVLLNDLIISMNVWTSLKDQLTKTTQVTDFRRQLITVTRNNLNQDLIAFGTWRGAWGLG